MKMYSASTNRVQLEFINLPVSFVGKGPSQTASLNIKGEFRFNSGCNRFFSVFNGSKVPVSVAFDSIEKVRRTFYVIFDSKSSLELSFHPKTGYKFKRVDLPSYFQFNGCTTLRFTVEPWVQGSVEGFKLVLV